MALFATRRVLMLLVLCVLWQPFTLRADENPKGVLIAAKNATVSLIPNREIRRIFLGLVPEPWSGIQRPVLNESNKTCYQEFLKNVMYLTDKGYRRKLVKRVFRQGADEIKSFHNESELVDHLKQFTGDISFACINGKTLDSQLKVVKVLWQ